MLKWRKRRRRRRKKTTTNEEAGGAVDIRALMLARAYAHTATDGQPIPLPLAWAPRPWRGRKSARQWRQRWGR
jgi:hypothetical protein